MNNFIEMGKTSLTYITQQNQELSAGIDKLKSGDLSAAELNALTENAKSLYEALVVLRFKAFEKQVGRAVETPEPVETKPEIVQPMEDEEEMIAFDLSQDEEEKVKTSDTSDTMFDFSGSLEEEQSTIERSTVTKEEFNIHSFDDDEKAEEDTEDGDSLNSQFTDTRDASLRKQLGRTAIKDLKAEIGIAKKFEYINSLFGGKAEIYDHAINELNTCGSDELAKNLLNNMAKDYNWDLDNKTIIKFIELVERRYI